MISKIVSRSLIILCPLSIIALLLNNNPISKARLADYYEKKGDKDRAAELYQKILPKLSLRSKNPFFNALNSSKGYGFILKKLAVFYEDKDNKKAIHFYEALLKEKPQDKENYKKVITLYVKGQDYYEAAQRLVKYKNSFNEDFPLEVLSDPAYWNYRLGIAYIKYGLADKALGYFKKCLSYDFNFADAHFWLGKLSESEGDIATAKIEYEKALDLLPNHIGALEALMSACQRQGLFEDEKKYASLSSVLIPPKVIPLNVNLSNKVEFIGYTVEQKNNETEFLFWFKCMGKIEEDYNLWLYCRPKKMANLDFDRQEQGFSSYCYDFANPTTKWQVGGVYSQGIRHGFKPGEYFFRLGLIKYVKAERPYFKNLYDLKTKDEYVDICRMNIN